MRKFISLKFYIPAILTSIVVFYLIGSWFVMNRIVKESVVDTSVQKSKELAHKIAHDVEVVLKYSHNAYDINDILVNYLLTDINKVIVYDDRRTIIYQSQTHAYEYFDKNSLYDLMEKTFSKGTVVQSYDAKAKMIGNMVPYVFPAEDNEILSERKGVVYFEYNLLRDISIAKRNFEKILLFFVLGNLLLVFIIIFFLNNRIIKRVLELSKATKAISDGVLNYRVDYDELKNQDEIDHLYASFNTMADTLSENSDKVKIAYDALMLKTEEANRANSAKSDFLANMSHEIRTPLNAMLGFLQILQKKEEDKERLKFFHIINESSKNLLGIINDILDFSKIESGKLEIDLHDFHAQSEFKTIFELYRHKAEEKSIEFICEIDERMPEILYSDPLRIKQVIANLLSNAVKFSKKNGHIKLRIAYDEKNEELKVDVEDDGIGIEADKQKNIFQAFTQSDSSITRKYGGTGLGLSISYYLVEMLGGKLSFKSTYDQGTTFSFYIPVKIGEKIGVKTEEGSVVFSKQRILLVEDNKSNQMLMTILLDDFNLSYEIAEDGQQAVEKFEQEPFDLILMDENMPKMNGIEATRQIRIIEKERHDPSTPIIALTANVLKGDRERFLDAGMDEYLSKPIDKIKLQSILKHFLNLKQMGKNSISTLSVADMKRDGLALLFGLDPEDVTELLKVFYINAKKNMKKMQKSILLKAYPEIARSAHAIKGSALNLRLDQIAQSADLIEISARKEENIDYSWYYEQLDKAIEKIQ